MLTDTETALIADALILRADEQVRGCGPLWFAVNEVKVLPEAHRLVELGYLQRRYDRDRGDLQYRATDMAAKAQSLHAATAAVNPN